MFCAKKKGLNASGNWWQCDKVLSGHGGCWNFVLCKFFLCFIFAKILVSNCFLSFIACILWKRFIYSVIYSISLHYFVIFIYIFFGAYCVAFTVFSSSLKSHQIYLLRPLVRYLYIIKVKDASLQVSFVDRGEVLLKRVLNVNVNYLKVAFAWKAK